ncbi:MAG: hypothetical protein K0U72_13650 [Gammaproteobacteria bacterium]|nr:hypothetical protein [Gammaproteobacteria bacterium]
MNEIDEKNRWQYLRSSSIAELIMRDCEDVATVFPDRTLLDYRKRETRLLDVNWKAKRELPYHGHSRGVEEKYKTTGATHYRTRR